MSNELTLVQDHLKKESESESPEEVQEGNLLKISRIFSRNFLLSKINIK